MQLCWIFDGCKQENKVVNVSMMCVKCFGVSNFQLGVFDIIIKSDE